MHLAGSASEADRLGRAFPQEARTIRYATAVRVNAMVTAANKAAAKDG